MEAPGTGHLNSDDGDERDGHQRPLPEGSDQRKREGLGALGAFQCILSEARVRLKQAPSL